MNDIRVLRALAEFDADPTENQKMTDWDQYSEIIQKDIQDDVVFRLTKILSINPATAMVQFLTEGGNTLGCSIKKEKRFFIQHGPQSSSVPEILDWLSVEGDEWISSTPVKGVSRLDKGEAFISLSENLKNSLRDVFFEEIKSPTRVFQAKVKSKNNGGFIVDIEGHEAFLPGSLASANKIIDFDAFIGKTVNVMIEDYLRDGDIFIVSNKKWIQKILPETIEKLSLEKEYTGVVTGTSRFGIFIEFEDILTGLLHVSEMDSTTSTEFNKGLFNPGNKIKFYIKEIAKNNKIILSSKKPKVNAITFDKFKELAEGKTLAGTIISLKNYGAFVKFVFENSDFIGLLYYKEYPLDFYPEIGDDYSFFLYKIDLETEKIHLRLA